MRTAREDLQDVRSPGATCQRRKIARGRARKAGKSNGRVGCMRTRAEHCERLMNSCKLVSNPRLTCQRRSITHRGVRRVRKPNGRMERVHARAERCEWLTKAWKQIRTHQKTPKPLHEVRLTWQKPRPAPRGATRAQEPRRCIGHMHARAVRSNRCENGCNNTRQKNAKRTETAQLTYWHKELAKRMAWGTMRMFQPHGWTCRAMATTWKLLRMWAEKSE